MSPRIRRCPLALLLVALPLAAFAEQPSADGAAAARPPVDRHGRPLADENGPLRHRLTPAGWVTEHADGRRVPSEGPGPSPEVEPVPSSLLGGTGPSPRGASRSETGWQGRLESPLRPRPRSHSAYVLLPYEARAVGSSAEAVAIGDVTADGRPDVVLTTEFGFDDPNDYHVFVFPQLPGGTLGAPTKYPYLATGSRNGIVLVDLDEDGLLDVVVGHGSGISVLLQDGLGGLEAAVVHADQQANSLAAMDVDRDTHQDVISLSWSTEATVFFGDGTGGFRSIERLDTNASGYNDHEVEDLTDDCFLDLGVLSGQGGQPRLTVHRHDGAGGFDPALDTYDAERVNGIGLGDVDDDGRHDVVMSRGGNRPTNLWVRLQNAGGTLDGPTAIDSYDIPEPVEVTDVDADGVEDVAVLHGGWNRIGLYLQDPGLGLEAEVLYPIPYASHYAAQGLAIGDFSGDGCPDVAIADYNNGLVILNGSGCFTPLDDDGDVVPDLEDNCPLTANGDQRDWDCDGVGDPCDACPFDADEDLDGDGLCANDDNCPDLANPGQEDRDLDSRGDACDPCPDDPLDDADADGHCGDVDNCPDTFNPGQEDADGNGVGDACEPCAGPGDADLDGVCDDVDNCPGVANPVQEDADGDGAGDACDPCPDDPDDDVDADGICGDLDNCPDTFNPTQEDLDGNGVGDACEPCPGGGPDTDGDGICDAADNCPLTSNPSQADADGDGAGDACDPCPNDPDDDRDGDALCADRDNCPDVSNPGQADADGDGAGDACDPCPDDPDDDLDGDGVCGDVDNCPAVANPGQEDADLDATGDPCDVCPFDPADDVDGDGFCADVDNCADVANPGQEDADLDGAGDPCDPCPLDPDDDLDGDSVCGDVDNCPSTPNGDQADLDGDGAGDACDPDRDGDGYLDPDDCGPDDPSLGDPPGEVPWLRVDAVAAGGDRLVLSWSDERVAAGPNAGFDVAAGRLDELHLNRGFALPGCLVRGLDDVRLEDEPLSSRWYLVRVRSDCGLGTYGRGSGGERAALDDPTTGACP